MDSSPLASTDCHDSLDHVNVHTLSFGSVGPNMAFVHEVLNERRHHPSTGSYTWPLRALVAPWSTW